MGFGSPRWPSVSYSSRNGNPRCILWQSGRLCVYIWEKYTVMTPAFQAAVTLLVRAGGGVVVLPPWQERFGSLRDWGVVESSKMSGLFYIYITICTVNYNANLGGR